MKRCIALLVVVLTLLAGTVFAAGTGTLKGNVWWHYSKFEINRGPDGSSSGSLNLNVWSDKKYASNKGDTGARIEVIPTGFNKKSISSAEERAWYTHGQPPAGRNIFVTQANNGGYYEIAGIPEGEYMVIVVSRKAKEDIDYADPALQNYIGNWDLFNSFVLSGCAYETKKVRIRAGATTVVNQNFDYTVQHGYYKTEA